MISVGVDPGVNGAIALVSSAHGLIYADDMPAAGGTGSKRKVVPALVVQWFRDIEPDTPDIIVIENVHAMPRQGVTSSFGFGRSLGVIEGVAATMGARVEMPTPQTWKKAMGVGADKDQCRARACELWPDRADLFRRKKDADRAEAALLAEWGLRLARGER